MEEKTIEGRCISVDGTIKFDYYYGIGFFLNFGYDR